MNLQHRSSAAASDSRHVHAVRLYVPSRSARTGLHRPQRTGTRPHSTNQAQPTTCAFANDESAGQRADGPLRAESWPNSDHTETDNMRTADRAPCSTVTKYLAGVTRELGARGPAEPAALRDSRWETASSRRRRFDDRLRACRRWLDPCELLDERLEALR